MLQRMRHRSLQGAAYLPLNSPVTGYQDVERYKGLLGVSVCMLVTARSATIFFLKVEGIDVYWMPPIECMQ
jgi:hypothetical protein